jgi:hypothetical protein
MIQGSSVLLVCATFGPTFNRVATAVERQTLTFVRFGRSNLLTWSNFRFAIDSNCSRVALTQKNSRRQMPTAVSNYFSKPCLLGVV